MAELAGFGSSGGVAGSLGREGGLSAERPVLVDRFLEDAVEVDVDAVRDGTGEVLVGGVMEHVEEAGVHSGDSACAIPPPTLSGSVLRRIEEHTTAIAHALEVVGLLNVQYAVKDGEVFVIEANPRASRTVPFVAKATGVPLAKVAARVMAGASLQALRDEGVLRPPSAGGHVAVKEAVLPFNRFPDVDTLLGPEMRSTGEVMGIDRTVGLAFAKSQMARGTACPTEGRSSCRSPTATSPPAWWRPAASLPSGSRSRPPPAPLPTSRSAGSPSTPSSARSEVPGTSRPPSTSWPPARSTSS
jgi:carbamoyl-phosphate synthase large subunit